MASPDCYPEKAPKINRLLESLGNSVRREVIHFFENAKSERTATLDELVDHVDDRMPHVDRRELKIKLLQIHLPKLSDRGWLDFDRRTEQICYYGHETVEQLLAELLDVFME